MLLAAAGLALLAADVPAWNTLWYLFGWYGWLLVLDALLARHDRSWLVGRRGELALMLVASVPFWYLFEAYNLRLENWYYVFVLRDDRLQLVVSLLAFATVIPACLLHAELVAAWAPGRSWRSRSFALGPAVLAAVAVLGIVSLLAPLLWPRWAFPLVWGATLWLPELLCLRLRAPSLLRELAAGRPQRTLHLLAGGLLAGVVWELLNFWARCKWIYTVPFFDRLKLFEMPLLGFLGFPLLALGAAATWSALVASWGGAAGTAPAASGRRRALLLALLASALLGSVVVYELVLRHTVAARRPLLSELALDGAAVRGLAGVGISTPELLERAVARQGLAAVAAAAGLRATELEPAARQGALALHKGLGASRAAQLLRVGVGDVATLGRAAPAPLAARLSRLAAAEGIAPPRRAEIEVWVRAARGRVRPSR